MERGVGTPGFAIEGAQSSGLACWPIERISGGFKPLSNLDALGVGDK
jgi:hypothetical protein